MGQVKKWTSEQYDAEVANLIGIYSARQDQLSGVILPDDPYWTPHIDKAIAELEINIKEYETKNGLTLYEFV
ncbi:hypothetical protein HAR83_000367 [Vibrio metschnikovii]|nr:hypothetical protein [Vibrio metschnikovii]